MKPKSNYTFGFSIIKVSGFLRVVSDRRAILLKYDFNNTDTAGG